MFGDFMVVDNVADTFARQVVEAYDQRPDDVFSLALTGGSQARSCYERLAQVSEDVIDWLSVNIYWGDERCVPADDPDSNQLLGRQALLERVGGANAIYPMSCKEGPDAYQLRIGQIGHLDVIHLGMGSDGHTASLFPNSAALDADPGQLVACNQDPSGRNVHPRMTLTYAGIARARLVLFTVAGAAKRDIVAQLLAGADLPAARVRADRVVWLVDRDAASVPAQPVPDTTAEGDERPELGPLIEEFLDAAGAQTNRDQLRELVRTVVALARDRSDRLDLKIANAALREMREGFEVFAPYRDVRKITMFGSARTARSEPLYAQARDLAARLAARQWSTVTGAGPGIMAAGFEGAGIDHSFGINIRLPFEQGANEFIAHDSKLVSMKYFFTRKLLLVEIEHGYAVLPGGFGTLDEAFELLTLLQTGKAAPAPVVLLDVPGGGYWEGWERFVVKQVEGGRLVGPYDRHLYLITDDVGVATDEILGFYRNYHSIRHVGDRLVIRLQMAPSPAVLAELSDRYADICAYGSITALDGALSAERRPEDHPELPRVALHFDLVSYARLRMLINELNALVPAL